jgi:hypothetical protein
METQQLTVEPPAPATVWESLGAALAQGKIAPESLEKILNVQMQHDRWVAEKEFNAAFVRMKFPPIKKTSRGVNSDYAPYEKIMEIVDPILQSEGFGLTFTTGPADEQGRIPIIGTLLHRMGHSRDSVVYQPTGTVSRGMNANQAMGSASTYGQRDCARLILNLKFVGLDNNAESLGVIDERQILNLQSLIEQCRTGDFDEARFWKFVSTLAGFKLKTLSDIPQRIYRAVKEQLEDKLKRQEGQKK